MIDTKLLAETCGKSLKTITKWAAKNGVAKNGYRWDFSPDDCRKLFAEYNVDPNELPPAVQMNLFTDELPELPSDELDNRADEPSDSTDSFTNEANDSNEQADNPNEALLESYKSQIELLQKQIEDYKEIIDDQHAEKMELIKTNREYVETIKALEASNAMREARETKEVLLVDSGGEIVQEKEEKQQTRWQKFKSWFA